MSSPDLAHALVWLAIIAASLLLSFLLIWYMGDK